MKTSELTGAALDWAVGVVFNPAPEWGQWEPSTDWSQGGPIIERELIDLLHVRQNDLSVAWDATFGNDEWVMTGPTPLVAAMRCFVASRLGDEVNIPEALEA